MLCLLLAASRGVRRRRRPSATATRPPPPPPPLAVVARVVTTGILGVIIIVRNEERNGNLSSFLLRFGGGDYYSLQKKTHTNKNHLQMPRRSRSNRRRRSRRNQTRYRSGSAVSPLKKFTIQRAQGPVQNEEFYGYKVDSSPEHLKYTPLEESGSPSHSMTTVRLFAGDRLVEESITEQEAYHAMHVHWLKYRAHLGSDGGPPPLKREVRSTNVVTDPF